MADFQGRCLCGGVRFTVTPPTLFCAHCHCRFCRAAHGAAFVTWVGAPEERFALVAGDDLISWYQSSEQSRRGFCSRCGTTIFYASSVAPGEIHIVRSCFESEIDREPRAHVFYDQRVAWSPDGDDLPKLASDHEALGKYRDVGR